MVGTKKKQKKKANNSSKAKARNRGPTTVTRGRVTLLDRIHALPGELREMIYRATFPGLYTSIRASRKHRWREPGLLRMSPTIRSEAQDIYYSERQFTLNVPTHQLAEACDFIKTVHARCGGSRRPFGAFHFYITSSSWTDLDLFLSVAQLFHKLDIELSYGEGIYDSQYDVMLPTKGPFIMKDVYGQEMCSALWQPAQLGVKAREQGRSEAWLGVEFTSWVERMRSSGYVVGQLRDAEWRRERRVEFEQAPRRRFMFVRGAWRPRRRR